MSIPPLGFIEPANRTREQADAHEASLSRMAMFTMTDVNLPRGTKVMLTDFLKAPEVVADMGMEFRGFRQLTGSCVGVTEGEITAVLSAIQRKVGDSPTQAFVPWWPYAYGRTRFNEGDRGQGEGAVSSVMGRTLEVDGTFARSEAAGALPMWDTRDGLCLSKSVELQWSDGGSGLVTKYLSLGRTHLFGARAVVRTPQQVVNAIANGYPVANGCALYVGGGSIQGDGADAYVRGRYDGRGGHETSWIGAWNHPTAGMLYLYWNHWDASTYPADPAGGPRCSTWVPESEVTRMLNGGSGGIDDGEAFAVSHLSYFPAQVDKILDYTQI